MAANKLHRRHVNLINVRSLFTIDFGVDVEAGSSFEIVFDNYYRPAYVGLDNVAFNIVNVPAPGALALLGIAGVAGNRRRRG